MSVDWPALVPRIAHEVRTLARKGLSNAQLVERTLGPAADGKILGPLRSTIESQISLNLLFVRLVLLADAEAPSSREEERVALETAVLGAKLECKDAILRE